MKTMREKSLALLLCLVLCLSLFPASAFADSAAGVPEDVETPIEAGQAPEAVADEAAGDVVASGECGDYLTW